jgi:ketosteroid isomerase-like protein
MGSPLPRRNDPTPTDSWRHGAAERMDETPEEVVARLDAEFQSAVASSDVAALDRMLAADFVSIGDDGEVASKADLIEEARNGIVKYEIREDSERKVRVWRDTAVVTGLLWAKGSTGGTPFDREVWFSTVYVRSTVGWLIVLDHFGVRVTRGLSDGPSQRSRPV